MNSPRPPPLGPNSPFPAITWRVAMLLAGVLLGVGSSYFTMRSDVSGVAERINRIDTGGSRALQDYQLQQMREKGELERKLAELTVKVEYIVESVGRIEARLDNMPPARRAAALQAASVVCLGNAVKDCATANAAPKLISVR